MDIEQIKELIDMMKDNDLNEIEIVDGQTRIALKRGGAQVTATPAGPAPVLAASEPAAAESAEEELARVTSPIVGTLYVAPSPNAEPFVKVGDHVNDDTIVCIIEAMKVMNEIKAGVSGTIRKLLAPNGSAVEFGQALFLVEPD